jgi:hypothetical protein
MSAIKRYQAVMEAFLKNLPTDKALLELMIEQLERGHKVARLTDRYTVGNDFTYA